MSGASAAPGRLPARADPALPARTRRRRFALERALVAALLACAPAGPLSAHHGESAAHAHGAELAAVETAARAPARAAPQDPRPAAQPVHAHLLRIDDGDSFVARPADGSATIRVRLAGIDAPERTQPWAKVARSRLQALLDGRTLTIVPLKSDRWGRFVALVDVEGDDASLEMLEAGLAWHFVRYDKDLPAALRGRYAKAAAAARRERAGLWRGEDPEPPWKFRQRTGGRSR